jgi:hypothetical protein
MDEKVLPGEQTARSRRSSVVALFQSVTEYRLLVK